MQDPDSRSPSGTLPLEPDADAARTLVRERPPTEGDTLLAHPGADSGSREPQVADVEPMSFDPGQRYADRKLLGEGGMGEVRLCADRFVGRDVAMKILRPGMGSQGSAHARFLREARVQGQLEHPSVVPVYDIGRDMEGRAFFTMKRVKGHTLEEIVAGLAAKDEEMERAYPRRKLLAALSQACLAVELSHRRGVLHRDLKPANVMLGDFGEVYVLDWGVAKIVGAADLALEAVDGGDATIDRTQVGALVGTPGYMAPEQARGASDAIGPAADVYALGAILFELLALVPLRRGRTVTELLVDTVRGEPASPRTRAPDADVPPELDEVCIKACALEPEARFPTARALGEAIESYLSGERDAEHRAALAREHIERARRALERASGSIADDERARAMRELSRALALEPSNEEAAGLLMQWVVAMPSELPPEAEAEIKEVERRDRAQGARRAAFGFLSWYLITPLVLWMGVRDWKCVLWAELAITAFVLYALWMWRTGKAGPEYMRWGIVLSFLVVSGTGFLLGPFVLTPAFAVGTMAVTAVGIRANRNTRGLILALALLSVFVPFGLQHFGVTAPSYAVQDGKIVLLPVMTELPPMLTLWFVVLVVAAQFIITMKLMGYGIEQLVRAERQNFAQAWRLRQLLPSESRPGG